MFNLNSFSCNYRYEVVIRCDPYGVSYFFTGLQLSSQLLSDLKRASTINKTYRMRYSATEEELLQSLSNTHSVPAQGNVLKYRLLSYTNVNQELLGVECPKYVASRVTKHNNFYFCNVLISVHCQVDLPSSGGADNSFNSSLGALHSTSGDEYHVVHSDHDELTDVHSANSPASTPPPTVVNRKRSSPTGSNSSSTELEDSPGSAVCTGKYLPLHVRCSQTV